MYINRIFLYFLACIPIRFLIILALLYIPKNILSYYSYIFLFMGISFFYTFIKTIYDREVYNIVKRGLFDGYVWWNPNRLIHAIIYILSFKLLVSNRKNQAIKLLISDLFFGIITFILYYGYLLFKDL